MTFRTTKMYYLKQKLSVKDDSAIVIKKKKFIHPVLTEPNTEH